tara:strand:- start:141 stop:1349 length:1209 start_codon:yes stop_codon:yes gene_type:complete
MTLKESVDIFVEEQMDYYNQWILDEPIFISERYNDNLGQLQRIMHKLIYEFVTNYSSYKFLMPVSPAVERIIKLFSSKPYKIGTYRTDFVFDSERQVKLIEITCRFAMNGIFSSSILNQSAQNYIDNQKISCQMIDFFSPIFKKLNAYLEGVDSIVVLKGSDLRNESKIYTAIFERIGLKVRHIHYNEISNNLHEMQNSWIISELSFEEILSIDFSTLEALMPLDVINDFRTVFLIHDKRFFEVLGNPDLLKSVLNEKEILFFDQYYIPTYSYDTNSEYWKEARYNKDNWILKHRALGKSQDIYAGIVTEQEEWEKLFQSDKIKEMVLQKWINQTRYKNTLKGEPINDYITGTLLYFDNDYYGFGDFRTSSFPVTNKVDHRKMAGFIVGDNENKTLRRKIFK